MVVNLAEEGNEDQEMALGYLLHIVDRPTGGAGKSLDVDGDDSSRFPHHDNVYGLLVSESQAGVTAEPVKHREDVELRSQVGIVCRHLLSANSNQTDRHYMLNCRVPCV